MVKTLVTTRLGFERKVAKKLEELGYFSIPIPRGHRGIVLTEAPKEVCLRIPEVEYAFEVLEEIPARLEEIVEASLRVASLIPEGSTFAVRTERRGKHAFSSLQVNSLVGARVVEKYGLRVNLSNPDYVIWINILDDNAYISLLRGEERFRKYVKKKLVLNYLKKITFGQLFYWGPGSEVMGEKIGRAAQAFEIGKLYLLTLDPLPLEDALSFLKGVKTGIDSRFEVQRKTYGREVKKIKVYVDHLYEFFNRLNRKKVGVISTDPTGRPAWELTNEVKELFKKKKEVVILAGSREGLPKGILRNSDLVIDLAPGITFATEHTIPVTISYIISVLGDLDGDGEDFGEKVGQNNEGKE